MATMVMRKSSKKKKPAAAKTVKTVYGDLVPAELVGHIAPALRIFATPISSLKLDPRNARAHGSKSIDGVLASLREFGQQKPVIFDNDRTIRAGNGTHQAAASLGWKYVAAIKSDLTGDKLKAYALADNRTAELSEWNTEELEAQLAELKDADLGLNLDELGLGEIDLEAIVAEAEKAEKDQKQNAGGAGVEGEGGGSQEIAERYEVVIECGSEGEQRKVFERLKGEGLKARALTV